MKFSNHVIVIIKEFTPYMAMLLHQSWPRDQCVLCLHSLQNQLRVEGGSQGLFQLLPGVFLITTWAFKPCSLQARLLVLLYHLATFQLNSGFSQRVIYSGSTRGPPPIRKSFGQVLGSCSFGKRLWNALFCAGNLYPRLCLVETFTGLCVYHLFRHCIRVLEEGKSFTGYTTLERRT